MGHTPFPSTAAHSTQRLPMVPVQDVRALYPALSLRDDGVARVYVDNPAGTQVPEALTTAALLARLRSLRPELRLHDAPEVAPLYACDPNLALLGTKSLGRELFRDEDVPVPDGVSAQSPAPAVIPRVVGPKSALGLVG